MKATPQTTTAQVLATGPSLKNYKPLPDATTYGVNDIFSYHPVMHLVTLDNPWQWHTHTGFNEVEARRQIATIGISNPKYWHFWKETGNEGIAEHPGYTFTPLTHYSGRNLFGPCCPKWATSDFVATALAARHGHTTIITYGIDWYGHPVHEAMLQSQLRGFTMLRDEMNAHGITLYCASPNSALAKILPVFTH